MKFVSVDNQKTIKRTENIVAKEMMDERAMFVRKEFLVGQQKGILKSTNLTEKTKKHCLFFLQNIMQSLFNQPKTTCHEREIWGELEKKIKNQHILVLKSPLA